MDIAEATVGARRGWKRKIGVITAEMPSQKGGFEKQLSKGLPAPW